MNIDQTRILSLMSQVEDLTNQCFGDVYPELENQCFNALDGKSKASFVINQLSKLVDSLSEKVG